MCVCRVDLGFVTAYHACVTIIEIIIKRGSVTSSDQLTNLCHHPSGFFCQKIRFSPCSYVMCQQFPSDIYMLIAIGQIDKLQDNNNEKIGYARHLQMKKIGEVQCSTVEKQRNQIADSEYE